MINNAIIKNERVFYGRFQGRGLGPYKTNLVDAILPQVRIDVDPERNYKPQEFFKNNSSSYDYYCLEIGFGTGDHLATLAEHYKDRGYIGCEVYLNGIASLLEHIDKKSLHDNVRIFPWVIQDLIAALDDQCLDDVFIMFPDPWPKARHEERRLVNTNFLNTLSRVLKIKGKIHLASDDSSYINFTLKSIKNTRTLELIGNTSTKPNFWPQITTRYEQKAIDNQRPCTYLTLLKI